tara:strand:+ start:2086 stop:3912 length:1827 start_codon:yes stop_codon:yes gene_type:complete
MALNKIPQRAFDNDDFITDTYTATAGQTNFTMSRAAALNSILVHINDVIQQPTADYTTSGTTLTLTSGANVGDDVRVRIMSERPLGTQSGGAGATTIGGLNDVDVTGLTTGQVLKWNGTQFTPAADATGGGGSSLTIQEEGSSLSTAATTLNFVGSAVTASGTGATKTITITGGGSGIALTDLSVGSEGSASGNGAIAYNSGTGVFTYSPPTLNGLTNAGDVDFGSNKILYSNNYANLADLPSASTYHGMAAHVHAVGALYYAHAGAWVRLANYDSLNLNGLTDVSTSGVTSGQVLKYNGTSWAPAADSSGSGGIALGDLSIGAEGTASGDGSLAYNNSTGVFTYTPPVIPSVALPDDQEFGVTNSGASAYTFSGAATGNNPTITLQRGKTYRFDVNATGHPFAIRVSNGGSAYTNGVENANATSGAVYFTVPDDAPNSLVYQCTSHAAMVGTINIIDKIVPGHVIQMANSTLAGSGNVSTTTTYTSTGNTLQMTPLKAGSKVMVHYTHVMRITPGTSHTRADLRLIESSTGTVLVDEKYVGEESRDNGADPIQNFAGTGVFTTTNTNQLTFVLQFRKANAAAAEAGNIYYSWYTGSVHTMQALEIAQ